MPWHVAIAAFGVTAALLLVGGAILLRFARDRHHFLLMRAALEKGVSAFPQIIPPWLVSMRVGTMALVLGLGVAGTGVLLCQATQYIDLPPTAGNLAADTSPAPPPVNAGPRNNDRPAPPPPAPPGAMERWHRIESQRVIGLVAICAGAILALLGIVRIAFARMERRLSSES